MSKTKNKKAGKSAKDKLAEGAAKIKKAQEAEAEKERLATPVVIPASTRPIEEIIAERVKTLPGSVGLKIAEDTPIEETLRVLRWTTTLSDHVGFMIGDVINFGDRKYGDGMFQRVMIQTGFKAQTLRQYASTANRIAPSNRVAALTFSHHREILRIGNDEKIAKVLKEVGAQAEKGLAPTSKELAMKVSKLTPRKPKKPAKPASGKRGKAKAKKELPAYKPTDEEQSCLDFAEEAIIEAAKAIKEGSVLKLVMKLDNKEKHRWLKFTESVVTFYNQVDRVTGY